MRINALYTYCIYTVYRYCIYIYENVYSKVRTAGTRQADQDSQNQTSKTDRQNSRGITGQAELDGAEQDR
jgi:hypothetical protein